MLLKPRLAQEGKTGVYERLERSLIQVLADMEAEGIKVDRQALSRMSQHFAEILKRRKVDYALAEEFQRF